MMESRIGDPELGGFRPLTRDDIHSWQQLWPSLNTKYPTANTTVKNDDDTWLAHRTRQVKAQMSSARFMCSVRGCSQNDGIARHWHHRWKAERHQRMTDHIFIQI